MEKSGYSEERSDLYKNLKILSESSFPKKCATCGRVYRSPDDFISGSDSIPHGSGLKSTLDENDTPIIELFRNCVCGSTLMDEFHDRRDLSEQGLKRRETFQKILLSLEKKGIPQEDTRQELLKFMKGEHSPLLEKYGIHSQK